MRSPPVALIDRRSFGRLLAGASAAWLTGCLGEDRRTPEDHAKLASQRRTERHRSGRGTFGPQQYPGYRGLAELPWYELGADGRLR